MSKLSKKQINAAKAAVALEYPQASRIQYHAATESISGYGWQLVRHHNAVGNIDRYGNGRFLLARLEFNGGWSSVDGLSILQA